MINIFFSICHFPRVFRLRTGICEDPPNHVLTLMGHTNPYKHYRKDQIWAGHYWACSVTSFQYYLFYCITNNLKIVNTFLTFSLLSNFLNLYPIIRCISFCLFILFFIFVCHTRIPFFFARKNRIEFKKNTELSVLRKAMLIIQWLANPALDLQLKGKLYSNEGNVFD